MSGHKLSTSTFGSLAKVPAGRISKPALTFRVNLFSIGLDSIFVTVEYVVSEHSDGAVSTVVARLTCLITFSSSSPCVLLVHADGHGLEGGRFSTTAATLGRAGCCEIVMTFCGNLPVLMFSVAGHDTVRTFMAESSDSSQEQ